MPHHNDEELDSTISGFLDRAELGPEQRQELTNLLLRQLKHRMDKHEAECAAQKAKYMKIVHTTHGIYLAVGAFLIAIEKGIILLGSR